MSTSKTIYTEYNTAGQFVASSDEREFDYRKAGIEWEGDDAWFVFAEVGMIIDGKEVPCDAWYEVCDEVGGYECGADAEEALEAQLHEVVGDYTSKGNWSGQQVAYKVESVDNGAEDSGTITTVDHVLEFTERWDSVLQEIVVDVTYEGQDLCKVFDAGKCFDAIGSGFNVSSSNKFEAAIKYAYNTI